VAVSTGRSMTTSRRCGRLRAAGIFLLGAAPLATAAALAQPADLPDGPGKEVVQRICSGCHVAEDVAKGPRRSREGWRQLVDDMVVRGAEGSDEDLTRIVNYLTTHFGPVGPE